MKKLKQNHKGNKIKVIRFKILFSDLVNQSKANDLNFPFRLEPRDHLFETENS